MVYTILMVYPPTPCGSSGCGIQSVCLLLHLALHATDHHHPFAPICGKPISLQTYKPLW